MLMQATEPSIVQKVVMAMSVGVVRVVKHVWMTAFVMLVIVKVIVFTTSMNRNKFRRRTKRLLCANEHLLDFKMGPHTYNCM